MTFGKRKRQIRPTQKALQDITKKDRYHILSLKKRELILRVSRESIEELFSRKSYFAGYVVVLLLVLFISSFSFTSNANVATFYPSSCLGGWEHPENAEGEQSLPDDASLEAFTKTNSAYLEGKAADIYCGGFAGIIPEETTPTKLLVSLSWSVDYGDVVHKNPVPVEVTSEGEIQGEEGLIVPAPEEEKDEAVDALPEEHVSDPTPEEESTQPSFEPDVKPQQEETVDEQSAPEPTNEVPTSGDPVGFIDRLTPRAYAEATDDIVVGEDLSSIVESEDVPAEFSLTDFIEVAYSVDGTEWKTLGRVGPTNWQGATFELASADVASWDEIANVQLRLTPLPTFDNPPVIYLDSISLRVEYEEVAGDNVTFLPPQYHIESITQEEGSKAELSVTGGFVDPEQIKVVTTGPLYAIAVYNTDTGEALLTTYSQETDNYVFDPAYFKAGNFTFIQTKDESMCAMLSLAECLVSPKAISHASFRIVDMRAPEVVEVVSDEEPAPDFIEKINNTFMQTDQETSSASKSAQTAPEGEEENNSAPTNIAEEEVTEDSIPSAEVSTDTDTDNDSNTESESSPEAASDSPSSDASTPE